MEKRNHFTAWCRKLAAMERLACTLVFLITTAAVARAECIPTNASASKNKDPLATLLSNRQVCPKNVFEFRALLEKAGAQIETSLVNNRGFHNPNEGRFSLFEIVSGKLEGGLTVDRGDLLFGHFTARHGETLVADQDPSAGLLIELIAWDSAKQFFNFYELTGEGARTEWFYRGDSAAILDDTKFLHRQPDPGRPKFGEQLRCSACHSGGGLIMKELAAPHNDWSTKDRALPFGSLRPDPALANMLRHRIDADELASVVRMATQRLEDSAAFRKIKRTRTMQEQLRPLFCPVEVNLESDPRPLDSSDNLMTIPSAFFADPRLATKEIRVAGPGYLSALAKHKSSMPAPQGRADADHGWLTPVKANSDIAAVEALVKAGIVDQEFVADVLAIDMSNPALSPVRCDLLKLVPRESGADFVARFKNNLKMNSSPSANALLDNMTRNERTAEFHQKAARSFLDKCESHASDPGVILEWFRILVQRREEVRASEISQQPGGEILEPGFRIIFPRVQPVPAPGKLKLTAECRVE